MQYIIIVFIFAKDIEIYCLILISFWWIAYSRFIAVRENHFRCVYLLANDGTAQD